MDDGASLADGAAFLVLCERCKLSPFDLDVLLIALAPDIDPQYERVFAYLQDDVSCKRPGINLILNLLCHSPADKLTKRAAFSAFGSLLRNRLIRLSGDESAPLADRGVCMDARVAAFLLGETGLDARLARFAHLIDAAKAADRSAGHKVDVGLADLARGARTGGSPLVVYFRGADEEAKRTAAAALACELEAALLIADVGHASHRPGDFEEWLYDLAREAVFQDTIVYYEGLEVLADYAAGESVLRALPPHAVITILSGSREWRMGSAKVGGVITVQFEMPSWQDRRRAWETALCDHELQAVRQGLDTLSECFRFSRSQIEDAALTAVRLASLRREPLDLADLYEAARARSGNEMGNLARKVVGVYGWDDIVLPEEEHAQLREICRRVALRHQVLDKWGFGQKLSGGKGVNALFHGPSGTGKTMAAEVIARELHLDLYKIDLAGVVSKYIGETEKNLDRIFAAAENANAVLLFDEADALFGKRSEVRDSHDRYANLEISYLLQKMEQYEGVAILATNLKQNLDDAFLRRLAFSVHFPFPDEVSRRRIWEGIWPDETPLAADLDPYWLASRFLLSGGNIRNVAMAAAFLAAEDETPVTIAHVLRAIRSEFLKMGKTLTEAELVPSEPLTAGLQK